MAGFARLIVTLSLHAAEFGVGMTAVAGMMVVPASAATSGWIVPDGRLFGISGVESGKAAPLVGGPPGTLLHTVVDGLPTGDTGATVPVVLTTIGVGMVPNGGAGIIAVDDIAAELVAMVETVRDTVGSGTGVMEGRGRGGALGNGGAGTVVSK
jgi:hypothetical protein